MRCFRWPLTAAPYRVSTLPRLRRLALLIVPTSNRQLVFGQPCRIHPDTHAYREPNSQRRPPQRYGRLIFHIGGKRNPKYPPVMVPSVLMTPTTIRKLLEDLLNAHALLLHFPGKQRHKQLQLVLNLNLRDIRRIGADSKVSVDPVMGPRGVTLLRIDVHQVIGIPFIFQFDNLRDGILHRFASAPWQVAEIVTAGGAIVDTFYRQLEDREPLANMMMMAITTQI